MNLLKNIKVKIKLIVAFLIVALLIGIVGGVGIMSLKNVGENAKKMYNQNLQNVYMLTDMKGNLNEIKGNISELLNMKDEKDTDVKDKLEKNIKENQDENDKYVTQLKNLLNDADEKKVFEQFNSELIQYRDLRENVLKLIDTKNYDGAAEKYRGK